MHLHGVGSGRVAGQIVDNFGGSGRIRVQKSDPLWTLRPHISAKAMLFARWQHHLRFCSGFSYAPLKAMVTKISK